MTEQYFIGFDISTSIVGVAVIQKTETYVKHVDLSHCQLTNCDDFWHKVDVMRSFLLDLKDKFPQPVSIGVEEALLGFRSGASSAQTITTLVAFNAIVRHLIREIWSTNPKQIPAPTARKLSGIKIIQKSKCGIDVKEQVFQYMNQNDLKDVQWPLKKATKKNDKPKVKDFAKDITDAYVIALATYKLNV